MSERERFEEGMPGLLKAMRWAYDNFYIKGYSNSDEREGYISALEDDLPVLFGQVDDLVALVARLARSLRKATPADALADGAMDYLRRKGLNPSPLRTVPEPGQAASGSSQGARSDRTRSQKLADAGFTRRPSLWALQAREALELIAAPQRADGSWNRDREACRQLAAEALGRDTDSDVQNGVGQPEAGFAEPTEKTRLTVSGRKERVWRAL